jgi:Txe/YoeB family toxin of Txe-Axe toxin-antitoxin module
MPRTATKTTVENVDDVTTVEEMNEKTTKNTKKLVNVEPLEDSDEIEVISLVSNVSYKDSKTLDTYEWREAGHVEYMTFETLKNMWRNNKGYFKNLWLKPNDDRVINKFSLTKTFEKYEYLMDGSNYTKKNINAICEAIKSTPNGLKWSICDKVKSLVISGEISNISVIRELEKSLRIDLISFLD